MGYDAGFKSRNDDDRAGEAVARYYEQRGRSWSYDADLARDEGYLYNFRGWCFSDLTREVLGYATGDVATATDDFGETWELDVIPVEVLDRYARAYRAFEETDAGQKILACEDIECDWLVGDVPDDWEPGESIAYINPVDMAAAKKALCSTGMEALYEVLDNDSSRIMQFETFSDIVGVLMDAGVEEVAWYESY